MCNVCVCVWFGSTPWSYFSFCSYRTKVLLPIGTRAFPNVFGARGATAFTRLRIFLKSMEHKRWRSTYEANEIGVLYWWCRGRSCAFGSPWWAAPFAYALRQTLICTYQKLNCWHIKMSQSTISFHSYLMVEQYVDSKALDARNSVQHIQLT